MKDFKTSTVSEKLTNNLDVMTSYRLRQFTPKPKLAKVTYNFHGLMFKLKDILALCCLSLKSLPNAAQCIEPFWKYRPWNSQFSICSTDLKVRNFHCCY